MDKNRIAKVIIALTTISAAIMELIDTSIVNVALSQMAGNLGASIEDISWVITSYAIANVIIIPMTGFLAQFFGRKRYYMASIIVFTIASVMCGMSTSIWMLVFWRFVQGLGGGGLLSTSQSILFDTFSKEKRAFAGALFGMGVVIGPTLGPTVGGLIIDNYAWPLIFNINVPFGIVACIMTYQFIDVGVERSTKKIPIDWYGILLLTIAIGAMQYVLDRGEADDWFDSSVIVWLSATAIIGTIGFIWWELRQKEPIVNLRILQDKTLFLTLTLTFATGFALFTSVFVFPLLLQRVLGYTAYETGITLLPSSLLSLIIMPIVGRSISAGVSPKIFIACGLVILASSGLMMAQADLNVTSSFFTLPLLIRGAGLACLFVPITTLAVQGLAPKDMPQGIALNNMTRQVGGSFGIAIINNFVAQRFAVHHTDLISNIYNGNPQYMERSQMLIQGLQSKLGPMINAQQQANQIIELTIMKQSYMITYLDAFLFSACCIIVVIPLLLFIKSKNLTAEITKEAMESSH